MSDFKRSARVAEGVRMELSAIIQDGMVHDPEVGFVTFTDVVVTDDLRHARVFVSVYGAADAQAKSLAALGRAAPFLRRELGARLRLRFVPELEFVHDSSLERGARIDSLLKRIERGETEDLAVEPMPAALPVSTGRDQAPLMTPPPPRPAKAPARRGAHRARAKTSSTKRRSR